MISNTIKSALQKRLSECLSKKIEISTITPVGGGDINECYQIKTNSEPFFLKVNDARKFPAMFKAESMGLKMLAVHSSFCVPKVIVEFESEGSSLLVLSHLSLTRNGDWELFGRSLAKLHLREIDFFGLEHSNYIGSLSQSNQAHKTWADFYREERLKPFFKQAYDLGYFSGSDKEAFTYLCQDLEQRFPIERPALLHGDLWSGNAAFCNTEPCIYDPAIYYGHREMDLGMTLLFGGFPNQMYESYNEIYPLDASWRERVSLTQLYPLLVHTLLFGGSYASQVKRILSQS